jgi:hypothetical protein
MRKEPSQQDLVSSQAIVLMEADITSEVAFVGLLIFWKEVVLLDGSLDNALAASSKRKV